MALDVGKLFQQGGFLGFSFLKPADLSENVGKLQKARTTHLLGSFEPCNTGGKLLIGLVLEIVERGSGVAESVACPALFAL